MLHHIAIATPRLEEMAAFYDRLPGLERSREWKDDHGRTRSVWYGCGRGGPILMLERAEGKKAPQALIFDLRGQNIEALRPLFTAHTQHTVYLEDPDGNRLGYSTYPAPLPAGLAR